MDTVATREAATVRNYAPAIEWLARHPTLPTPRGVQIDLIESDLSISLFVDTAEQAQAWADAMGVDLRTSEHKGKAHHNAHTFEPFYITATAIVG